MERRLFTILCGLSLLLCVASGALWWRSGGHFEQVDLRYAGWSEAEGVSTVFAGFSWYSSTLRCPECGHVPSASPLD